jgi:hypothetical protein
VSLPELDPEVEPEVEPLELVSELPLVPAGPLGFAGGVADVPVLMSLPASAPRARGSVSPRRPCGDVLSVRPAGWVVLVAVSLQAPTPTMRAAADAKAINLRVM